MEKQVPNWFNVESVPHSYIFPEEDRPGKLIIPICDTIPVIDLASQQTDIVHQISQASQVFGIFQVINHGVSENIIIETVRVLKEFLEMGAEEKANDVLNTGASGWIYTRSTGYAKDGVHLWRENIKHPCHPLDYCMQRWPQKPTSYREIVGAYLVEIRKLSLKILELIGEGLGLERGCLEKISEVQLMSASIYPACPDPSLTLGLLKHIDPSLITILFQGDVCGLQVYNDGQWLGVGVLPNSFVVNIGNQLEIISNGKLRSAEHRAVTNSSEDRTTIATFINPSPDSIIEPAKVLVDQILNPSRYKPILYKHFVHASKAFGPNTEKIQNVVVSSNDTIRA